MRCFCKMFVTNPAFHGIFMKSRVECNKKAERVFIGMDKKKMIILLATIVVCAVVLGVAGALIFRSMANGSVFQKDKSGDSKQAGVATTPEGAASITNFAGSSTAVLDAYLVGLDTLVDPEANLFFERIAVGADGHVALDGDLKVQGERWRRKVNGTLRLYRYPELGSSPSITNLCLEGGRFPLIGAEDTSGTNRFFKLVIE